MRVIFFTVLALLLSGPFSTLADHGADGDHVAAILDEFLSMKRKSVALHADLSEAEERKFWPVYDAYEEAMEPVLRELMTLLDRYQRERDSISENEANAIIDGLMRSNAKSMDVQRSYLAKFREILPARKVLDISAVIYGSSL